MVVVQPVSHVNLSFTQFGNSQRTGKKDSLVIKRRQYYSDFILFSSIFLYFILFFVVLFFCYFIFVFMYIQSFFFS